MRWVSRVNLIVFLFLCLWLGKVDAQQNSIGTWNNFNFKYAHSNKFSFLEKRNFAHLNFIPTITITSTRVDLISSLGIVIN
jgi:hypothetical protein